MSIYFILFFFIYSFLLIYISKKKKYFLDQKVEKHKRYSSSTKSYSLGGFLLISFFYFQFVIVSTDLFLLTFLNFLFLIGLLSDLKRLNSVSLRFFLQLIFIFLFIQILQLEINNTKIVIIDNILKNNYMNMIFVLFCLMILVNGSNFIDGINGLLIGYYIVVIFVLILKFDQGFNTNSHFLINLMPILLIIYILNIKGLIYMGDSGAYLLSLFVGIYLIQFSYFNSHISPYLIIVLLWYPCFELLFSMIRRNQKKKKTYKPDTMHLHQLLFSVYKKI